MQKRRKRRIHEEAEHNERWMVSYADFITLLFAFFVVMYSISSVNEGKYRVLTDALGEAFSVNAEHQPVQSSGSPIVIDTPGSTRFQPIKLDQPVADTHTRALSEEIIKEQELLDDVSKQFQEELGGFMDQKLVDVKKHDFWIELEMSSELLFASGESDISKQAIPILKKVADVVRSLPNMISVEGYTDNLPINTFKFSSNWDLASARASSVVKVLVNENIDPARLSAVGYGEFHAVADNTTNAGRFKNRRVVLLLMSRVFSRYGTNDQERSRLLNLEPKANSDEALENTSRQQTEQLQAIEQQTQSVLPDAKPQPLSVAVPGQ